MNQLLKHKGYLDNSTKTKQSGFSLIEVMIAALILSIGILGVTSLQVVD